ncbi:ribonuclease H-like domain-containing protein, partial [Tanacetum coccineum]
TDKDEYVFGKSVTSVPAVATSEAKTSKSKHKSVSEPLIEDWISDSENENETESKSRQRKPSNAKVEFVKSNEHVKSPRESVKKGNPQQDLKDKGVIDNGCFRHMTRNRSYLTDYEEIDGGFVAFGGSTKGGKITGKGKICTDTECVVLSLDFKLLDESHVLLKVPRKDNMYSVDLKNVVPQGGIKRELSVSRTPQQNGVAKRKNRTLIEAARTMLADSKLPSTFGTPSLSFMRPFRCHVTILNTLDHLGKFDGKVDEGFFVRYSMNSKAFRVFNSRTRIVEETLHVTFLENKPNVAGSRPSWLLDIDTLTKSMNYKPVVAGNQSNGSAGTKACDNAETSLGEEEKKDAKVPEKESGASSKKDDQDDQDLRDEFERLIHQEKDENVNNDDEDVVAEADGIGYQDKIKTIAKTNKRAREQKEHKEKSKSKPSQKVKVKKEWSGDTQNMLWLISHAKTRGVVRCGRSGLNMFFIDPGYALIGGIENGIFMDCVALIMRRDMAKGMRFRQSGFMAFSDISEVLLLQIFSNIVGREVRFVRKSVLVGVVELDVSWLGRYADKSLVKEQESSVSKDWVSDDEEQDGSKTKPEKKTVIPTAAKIEKPVRKPVKYAEMYRQGDSNACLSHRCWFGDTSYYGASWHMTGNIAHLSDFKDFDGGYVTFGGGAYGGRITGKGTIKTDNLDFDDVYCQDVKVNLFLSH